MSVAAVKVRSPCSPLIMTEVSSRLRSNPAGTANGSPSADTTLDSVVSPKAPVIWKLPGSWYPTVSTRADPRASWPPNVAAHDPDVLAAVMARSLTDRFSGPRPSVQAGSSASVALSDTPAFATSISALSMVRSAGAGRCRSVNRACSGSVALVSLPVAVRSGPASTVMSKDALPSSAIVPVPSICRSTFGEPNGSVTVKFAVSPESSPTDSGSFWLGRAAVR
jgi:hypothetical protein